MIRIDDKLVSTELFDEMFICNLPVCRGNCCVQGDAGAPLMAGEAELLEKNYPSFRQDMTRKGCESIEKYGKWQTDREGDQVTTLVDGKECAYAYFINGVAHCAIEKAFLEGRTGFRKPLSCHLYPIRISRVGEYTALNYHRWPICNPARELGREQKLPVFRFLKESITRAFGEGFYLEVEKVFSEYNTGFAFKQP